MLSKYKTQRAEAILCHLDSDITCALRAEYNCSVNGATERDREAHFYRLMGEVNMLCTMKLITFTQLMLLTDYYLDQHGKAMDEKSA